MPSTAMSWTGFTVLYSDPFWCNGSQTKEENSYLPHLRHSCTDAEDIWSCLVFKFPEVKVGWDYWYFYSHQQHHLYIQLEKKFQLIFIYLDTKIHVSSTNRHLSGSSGQLRRRIKSCIVLGVSGVPFDQHINTYSITDIETFV